MARLTLAGARALVSETLIRVGTETHNAESVARALVAAEADGLKGHGLTRVPSYAAQVLAGKVDGRAKPRLVRFAPSVLRIDAAHGFAYPALDLAVGELPALARTQGVAVAALARSHHCGAAGLVVEALAEQGCVAMLFANTPAAMALPGGKRALLGTNPIAFATPRMGGRPLVIDLSLSTVARGNILAAKQRGEPLPEGWARDAAGQPTLDPDAALAGTMEPMGGAKGAVLALMVEVLAGALTGANLAGEASSFLDDKGAPPATGQVIFAFLANVFAQNGTQRVEDLARFILDEPGTRLPGDRRQLARKRAAHEGLNVDDQLISAIRAIHLV